MFDKILLSQTAGTKLNFSPANSMGFTSGGNYVVVTFDSYRPAGTTVTLSFHTLKPSLNSFGLFSTSASFQIDDVVATEPYSVNAALEARVAHEVIEYLKSFNTGCDFEQDYFEVQS